MSSLLAFHFIRPLWLWALLPFLAMAYVALKPNRAQQDWKSRLPEHLAIALNVGEKAWRKKLPVKLWTVIALLAIVTAAGPTWQREAAPFGEDRSPVFMVLDLSESMLQKDIKPTRLARAKYKIQDLVTQNSAKKTALIVYAGSAHLAVPLTKDTQVFTPILNALSPEVMPRSGKYPEQALAVIEQQLNEQAEQVHSATIVLVTDGVGSEVATTYRGFIARDDIAIQLLILGVGNAQRGSDIPFDESSLKQLASSTGGDYKAISNDNTDINWLLRAINQHIELNGESAQPWKDMSYPLVFIIMFIFLLWFRKGWTVHWCLLPLIFAMQTQPVHASKEVASEEIAGFHFLNLWMTQDQQAQWYFERGEYLQAAERFVSSKHKAQAYYLAEEFVLAKAFYLRVNSKQGMLGAANSLAQAREYVQARAMYRQILAQYPAFVAAKTNLVIVEKIIEDINRQSESQANTENESSKEIGDAPQTSDGAEEKVASQQLQKQTFNADQLRNSQVMFDAWMKQVEGNQKAFLATKFSIQLLNEESK